MAAVTEVQRQILSWAAEASTTFRVVVLNGPRQSGKSTLLRHLQQQLGGTILNLDDDRLLEAALADPAGVLLVDDRLVFIDEVQRGGDALIRAIKARVDRPANETSFVLAGSTNFLTVPTLSESLAGRAVLIEVWPFSQGEIDATEPAVVDVLFHAPDQLSAVRARSAIPRDEYFDRICTGGFPEVARLPNARPRRAWFNSYVQTVTQRDIAEISRVRQAEELPRLLRFLAAKTAQELVKVEVAAATGLDRNTASNYIALLETVFLCRELPAWSRNPLGKVTKHPKIHLTDTGLAAALLGVTPASLRDPLATVRGQLVETFVYTELLKQRAWSETDFDLFHWRDRGGAEVDLILESGSGEVIAIESKSSLDVTRADFRPMQRLEEKLGRQFKHGYVVYLGQDVLPFGRRLTALPLAALWRPPA